MKAWMMLGKDMTGQCCGEGMHESHQLPGHAADHCTHWDQPAGLSSGPGQALHSNRSLTWPCWAGQAPPDTLLCVLAPCPAGALLPQGTQLCPWHCRAPAAAPQPLRDQAQPHCPPEENLTWSRQSPAVAQSTQSSPRNSQHHLWLLSRQKC